MFTWRDCVEKELERELRLEESERWRLLRSLSRKSRSSNTYGLDLLKLRSSDLRRRVVRESLVH